MNRRVVLGILVVLLLVVGAVAVGGYAYQLGVAQGLANSGKLVAPQGDGVAPFYYGAPYFFYPHPFGFGFGFLGCLFPLLGFFLFFALIRGLFWRGGWGGRRGWGGHGWGPGYGSGGPGAGSEGKDFGPGGQGVPPMFSEWHKRAHGEQKPEGTGQ
jgi:hypothetical protein